MIEKFSYQDSKETSPKAYSFQTDKSDSFYPSGTNLNAIRRSVPAPAIAAKTRLKSVGTVLDAKNIAENPTPIRTKGDTQDV